MNQLTNKQLNALVDSVNVRLGVTKESFFAFHNIYMSEHIGYPLADFHKEMIEIGEKQDIDFINIISFRGSGKSTIMNTSYVLWNMFGRPQKKFILLMGKTIDQAKIFLENIGIELQENAMLKKDFGIRKDLIQIQKTQIVIESLGIRIKIGSLNSSLRGLKRGTIRPDLIICDDLEDNVSVLDVKIREKTYKWFKQELIPLSGDSSQIVLLGNYLHKESLLNRIAEEIGNGSINGISRKYPLLSEKGDILWHQRFTKEDIEDMKNVVWDQSKRYSGKIWYSEYLMQEYYVEFVFNLIQKDGSKKIMRPNGKFYPQ